ncbi:XRE family transcriptional regulator [Brevibacillus laterosporus]|uniref:XRE family transcriptional regulator n=1 Tax=Brevibacillus laterosporus TaxID=1465 RepID=A0A502IIH6_BRELA|nr:helix-turn-helix transcriptional regulator [Brevibacillus laterosporus]QDX91423.1 XRE family transcriptional regulator [Brevibacillus laterosporus]TPG84980.1 XRE family transcriptional regulator [Brevibacillus laterosporus]TPG89929.1 XRE family transcriptional regulator [Brevibacillus laterosporus]
MTILLGKREKLKGKRLEKGFTREEFANVIGISKEHVKSLEYGRVNPSFKVMMKICDTLEGKPEELF